MARGSSRHIEPLLPSGAVKDLGAPTVNAAATVTCTVVRLRARSAAVTGAATVSCSLVRVRARTAAVNATATVSCALVRLRARAASVTGTSAVSCALVRLRARAAAVQAQATVTCTLTKTAAAPPAPPATFGGLRNRRLQQVEPPAGEPVELHLLPALGQVRALPPKLTVGLVVTSASGGARAQAPTPVLTLSGSTAFVRMVGSYRADRDPDSRDLERELEEILLLTEV